MSEGIKRRDFLKVLGAGSGVAAAGCSSGEVERLIPYVIPDEQVVPGVPTWYASTCLECPGGCGVQVETHSGRATKVEGNSAHPVNRGRLCARGQASVQGLYHPDRIRGPRVTISRAEGMRDVPWATAAGLLAERVREARPGRVALVTGRYGGTLDRLADDWIQAVGGLRVVYEPFGGVPSVPGFEDAELLVSLGADFLETYGPSVANSLAFAEFRRVRNGRRGKFVWVGPHRPLTGLNADEWIATRPGSEILVARALAGEIDPAAAARGTGADPGKLASLARDFQTLRSVALGPGRALATADSGELLRAVNRLNGGAPAARRAPGGAGDMVRLVAAMRRGQVDLVIFDANPAYTLPGSLGFEQALERVPTRVSLSSYPDDTAVQCDVLLPQSHFLEGWGDRDLETGGASLVQPAMKPVFNTKPVGDVLLEVARRLELALPGVAGEDTFYDYLRRRWSERFGLDDEGWRGALQRGGVFEGAAAESPEQAAEAAPLGRPAELRGPADGLRLVVYPSSRFYDGRAANRPWLLELPDPVTKVSWDSWVELHPGTARELGLEQGEMVEVRSPYGSLEAPVYVYAGVHREAIAIQTGLGHRAFGRYTEGRGVNPNLLLSGAVDPASDTFATYDLRVSVRRTGRSFPLFEQGARVQHDREVAQAVSIAALGDEHGEGQPAASIPGEHDQVATLRAYGGFVPATSPSDPGAYPPPGTKYGQYVEGATRWAMAIDLQRCTGCSACVTACYAENNIPVVGPDLVRRGREMSWLRIERYFAVSRDQATGMTQEATDDTRFLPMLCQHCGNAPCEPVCPVYAAYHTPDGLNAQVYNRCVGTRYCANNCPYKVRYFNWFTHDFAEPLNWQLNPDVTVREKGVMEKCTFCVQRINEAERTAARDDRPVRDGEVVPACVQTCPSEVFVFGNIADPESEVARSARSVRGYRVMENLNVQPAIVYLKKVTLDEPEQSEFAH
ncbi:MAG: molybdopterin dinucleotide binding domain-containing protein [Longimicrobiaceae bacterium]